MLVVMLMAAAAIMAFALLSNASMQSQISGNQGASVSASGLSESGVNLALYYLMYPLKASSADYSTGSYGYFYNPGTDIPSLRVNGLGSIDKITVSNSGLGSYTISVNGSDGSSGNRISRTTTAAAQVTGRYIVQYAMSSNDAFTIPLFLGTMTVNGNVRCDGGIGGQTSAITGATAIIPLNTSKPAFPKSAVPTYAQLDLPLHLPTYKTSDTADALSSATVTAATNLVTGKPNNPGNVWYYTTGDVTMTGTVTLNGTLVVGNGKNLIIGGAVTINPKTGYPGLIVANNIEFSGTARKLTVNGVCWLGQNVTGTGTTPQGTLTVNGSLMWGGTSPKFDTTKLLTPASKIIVTWPTGAATKDPPTPDTVYCPDLTDIDQTPQSIKLQSISSE